MMKSVLLKILLAIGLLIVVFIIFGPRENVDLLRVDFDGRFGGDVENYLAEEEAGYDDITDGTKKRIEWAGKRGEKTPLALVYIHGFSATNYEFYPVPEEVAAALGANLFATRLKGHGRSGEALAEADAVDWQNDLQEAVAIGQEIGDKVVVISGSTGGTLAAIAAADDEMASRIDGLIFVSPNFGIKNPMAPLLTWPAARYWLPLIAGKERSWKPENEMHGRYWTTSYPSVAVFPMAALVKKSVGNDYSKVKIPALFYYSNDDLVVDSEATTRIAINWGGDVSIVHPELGDGDDPYKHVLMGDALSPSQNEVAKEVIIGWIEEEVLE